MKISQFGEFESETESAVAKTIKRCDETGSHDYRKERPSCRGELTAPQIAAQKNASQSSSNRHISTSTVQRRLRESGFHGCKETTKGHQ
jgi:hypothetical protein